MLSAEVNRVLLLLGMGITGYLMILAWDRDFVQGEQTASDYTQSQPPLEAPAPSSADPSLPTLAPQGDAAAVESDVPDAALVAASAAPGAEASAAAGAAPAPAAGAGDRLVRVTTPRLDLWIDRLGGDIVRVELPEYPFDIDQPDVAFTLLNNGNGRVYVAQSGLMAPAGSAKVLDDLAQRPLYDVTQNEFELTDGELEVDLVAQQDGLQVTKTFRFHSDQFLVDVSYEVRNGRNAPIQASLFAQIKRDAMEPFGGGSWTFGPAPYLGAALTTSEERYQKLEFEDLDEGRFARTEQGGWMAFLQHYFLSAWVANPEDTNQFFGQKRNVGGIYTMGYVGPAQSVAPGATGLWQSRFYAGPKDQKALEEIAPNLNLTVDYGFLWWLAVPLFYILDALHGLVGNWGAAIILLTVLVKLVLYPLSAASYKSMANMRRVAPQLKRIQERFADDRQKLSQEMMALYKKEKVNPLGGCLPMLLPMPPCPVGVATAAMVSLTALHRVAGYWALRAYAASVCFITHHCCAIDNTLLTSQ